MIARIGLGYGVGPSDSSYLCSLDRFGWFNEDCAGVTGSGETPTEGHAGPGGTVTDESWGVEGVDWYWDTSTPTPKPKSTPNTAATQSDGWGVEGVDWEWVYDTPTGAAAKKKTGMIGGLSQNTIIIAGVAFMVFMMAMSGGRR